MSDRSDSSADNPERLARLHRLAPQEVIEAVRTSDDPDNDSRLTCQICKDPYYSADDGIDYETPYMTACGHIFGSRCALRWASDPTLIKCPFCRFIMHFKRCGHLIAPRPAFDNIYPTPPKITADERPDTCFDCEYSARKAVLQSQINNDRQEQLRLEGEATRAMMIPELDAIFPMVRPDINGQPVLQNPRQPVPYGAMYRLGEARKKARDALEAVREVKRLADLELEQMQNDCEAAATQGQDLWRYGRRA